MNDAADARKKFQIKLYTVCGKMYEGSRWQSLEAEIKVNNVVQAMRNWFSREKILLI